MHKNRTPTYHKIRSKVIDGEIPFGAQINIKALELEMRVSTIPIREALIVLATEDLIDFLPRRGFYNKKLEADNIVHTLDSLEKLLVFSALNVPVSRRRLLRKYLMQNRKYLINLDGGIEKNIHFTTHVFDNYFTHPMSMMTQTVIVQCTQYFLIDELKHECKPKLLRAIFLYFWLTSCGHQLALENEITEFFTIRKARAADTIQAAKDWELEAGTSVIF